VAAPRKTQADRAGSAKRCITAFFAGYEMVDFKAVLYDGSYHDVDSNEMAFKIAGFHGLQGSGGGRRARYLPSNRWMAVEVTVPEEHMGTIIGRHQLAPWPHRGHGALGWLTGDPRPWSA